MKKTIAIGMLTACALAGIGARGEELNVEFGETVTLTGDKTVDGGIVAGTLILENGVTLTLANNIFASTAVVDMRGATIVGFSGAHDVTLPCSFVIADNTLNQISNINDLLDQYHRNGCNVWFTGQITGAGTLTLLSTGRGFILDSATAWSEFYGTLNLNMSDGDDFSGRISAGNFYHCNVNVIAGKLNYSVANGTDFGSLSVHSDATFNCDRGWWNDSNILKLYSDSTLGGTFTGNELDVNVYNGAKVTIDADIARVHVDVNGALSGNGTIGTLRIWGNQIGVSNPAASILKIQNGHADNIGGALVITGEAGSRSGNPVLEVTDTSKFNVQLSSALAADGWKLKEESGVYSIYKNGLMIIIR